MQGLRTKGRRVAIVGAGAGGISAAIALSQKGYDVRLFEKAKAVTPLGGAVLLSLPVLSILRHYGVDIDGLGAYAVTEFRNWRGKLRTRLPFNKAAEEKAGLPGWHYGMLRAAAIARMLKVFSPELIPTDHKLSRYEETGDGVRLFFENGAMHEADILIGADGIHSNPGSAA